MMSRMLPITMIIPTYNRLDTLCETLSSLAQCGEGPDELVIIDQTPGGKQNEQRAQACLSNYAGRLVYLFQEEPSLTQARNAGINAASNEILVFSDDDITYEHDTFTNAYAILSQAEYALIAGLDRKALRSGSSLAFLFGLRERSKRNEGHVARGIFGRYPDIQDVRTETATEWAMGYFFAVKRSILLHNNLRFDETLGQYAYAEDLDFSTRYCRCAGKDGLKCILTPRVVVAHNCSKEYRSSNKKLTYMLVFNRLYLLHKDFLDRFSEWDFWWANVGILIKRIQKKDHVAMYLGAMLDCWRYREDVRRGVLHTELYR